MQRLRPSISDGLVQGSFPVLEPNEYKAFEMMPLVVETDPSPAAELPFHVAVALRIIDASSSLRFVIDRQRPGGCDGGIGGT
jgi:hypothetical protein